MRALLGRVVNAGTGALDPRELKHVRLTNQISLVAMAMSLIAFADPRIYVSPFLIATATAAVGVYATVLFLSSRRLHRASRLFVSFGTIAWVTTAGVLMGADTEQHLFLIGGATSVWFLMPRRERTTAAIVALLSGVCMVGVDLFNPARIALRAPGALPYDTADKITLFLILQALAYYAVTQTERAEDRLAAEQEKSEALLLNIFPRSIAEQLKAERRAIAERFEHATVLFADIVNFTQLSERTGATDLVMMLDQVFTRFDALADKHGLEKIKTIGDAYMVVGGLPQPRADHADAVARMALDMLTVLETFENPAFRGLSIRVGIHTGPVVAGVIGTRKFAYDLWGDSVNTASRMESHGQPGRVHVSDAVHGLLVDRFEFEARGPIQVKGKGELTTWFLTAERRS